MISNSDYLDGRYLDWKQENDYPDIDAEVEEQENCVHWWELQDPDTPDMSLYYCDKCGEMAIDPFKDSEIDD